MGNLFLWLGLIAGCIVAILIGGFGVVLLWKMATGRIDLSKLISEENGDASLSRFQFLIFTFVISTGLLLLILANIDKDTIAFPDIGSGTLALLGISGGSYVISKGIQKNSDVAKHVASTSADVAMHAASTNADVTKHAATVNAAKPGA